MTPRTIPQIRDRLHEIARDLADQAAEAEWFSNYPLLARVFAGVVADHATELHALAEETKRRPPVRHAPVAARKVTPEITRAIRATARANPDLTNREIGRLHGVDGGRVSETLAGKRGEEARP